MSAGSESLFTQAALAPAWPALAAMSIGLLNQRSRRLSERAVVTIAQLALWLSFLSVCVASVAYGWRGESHVERMLGHFYQAGDYGFELRFLFDGISLPVGLLATVLLLATSRFSAHYLHREPGFTRFFVLMLIFASGILLLLLAGSYDLLFAGWELVGLSSVLLVGFFQERAGPVRAALRVLITYRLCDVGLLVAPILLHLTLHSSAFTEVQTALATSSSKSLVPATAVSLFLLLAAMGKSAQFPVGGWLPRAMEGPTASSAVFYGALSVHAGVYLLLRSAALFQQAPLARAALVGVGLVTAVMAAVSGRASADAKSGLAYATISQVGLMFAECGMGWTRLATAHLIAHTILRYYQFLRVPSVLQDALAQRAALGTRAHKRSKAKWQGLTLPAQSFIYRLAIERFEVEASLERFLARPLFLLARWLGEAEARWMEADRKEKR